MDPEKIIQDQETKRRSLEHIEDSIQLLVFIFVLGIKFIYFRSYFILY